MPSCVSCSVVLIVILFLSLSPFNPGHAETWNHEVSVVQYGRLGSHVTLACGTSTNRTSVEWRLYKGLRLSWQQVTSEGKLVLLAVQLANQGNYSCYDNQGLLLQTITLRLGHPPGELDVSCRVPSHSMVVCSWEEEVDTHLPGQFYASYKATSSSRVQPCDVEPSHRGCIITQPTMWQPKHVLNVTQTNPLGSYTTMKELKLSALIKPDPPEDVEVMELEGFPRMLQVEWRAPSSWMESDSFPLAYELRYRPVGSLLWSSVRTNSSPLVIMDVLESHEHQLQIRARDDLEERSMWSEWSPLLQAWPWKAVPVPKDHEEEIFPIDLDNSDTETSAPTSRSQSLEVEEDGGLGLVILLSLFAAVILTSVTSIFILMWVRQRRRNHARNQKLTSLVKLKSMPI